jgi:RNA-directed DNA polymerase
VVGVLLHADQPQTPDQWEQWLKVTRTAIREHAITADAGNGKPDKPAAPCLIHTHCHRRLTTGTGRRPAHLTAREPTGLA